MPTIAGKADELVARYGSKKAAANYAAQRYSSWVDSRGGFIDQFTASYWASIVEHLGFYIRFG